MSHNKLPPVCSSNLFIYLLGLQCCLGTRQSFVCAFECVLPGCGIGVTVTFRGLPTAASNKEKVERIYKIKAASGVSALPFAMFYMFSKTGKQTMSTMLTTVWLTRFTRGKEGEVAQQLIVQHNCAVTFAVLCSPDWNGVLCLQRGHSGIRLLLLIIVVHC